LTIYYHLPGLFINSQIRLKEKDCALFITRTVKVINLSQFLLATLTILSWHKTYLSSTKSVTSALDKSCNRDNLICRRDLQKLRHGGLPAGTIFQLKYRDSYRRTAPPTFTPSTAGPLAHIFLYLTISPRPVLIKFYLDKINSALYRDLPSRDRQLALPPSPESSVI